MAFEDFLKQFSILNTAPWNSPPTFPVPEVGRLTAPPDELPGVRQSIQVGMDLIEPDMERARKNTLNNIGPMLAFLPLMLAGSKNRGKGLTSFARALGTGVSRERNAQEGIEYWRAEQMNTRTEAQRKALLEEIKQNRGLMEKAAGLDPALWGNQEFVNAWLSGDITYLPKAGWRPPEKAEKKSYQLAEVGGNKVVFDPSTGELVRTLGRAGSGAGGAPKEENPITTAEKVIFSYLNGGGDPEKLNDVQKRMAIKKGWLPEPDPDKPGKPVTEFENRLFNELQSGEKKPEDLTGLELEIATKKKWIPRVKETLTLPDKSRIYTEVMGGLDQFGRMFAGVVGTSKNAEQGIAMVKNRYADDPLAMQYALNILLKDPSSKYYQGAPQGATVQPQQAPVAPMVTPSPQGGATTPRTPPAPPTAPPVTPPAPSPVQGSSFLQRTLREAGIAPQGQPPAMPQAPLPVQPPPPQVAAPQRDFRAMAAQLLQKAGGNMELAQEYVRTARIPEEDKQQIMQSLLSLMAVPNR